jgi:hypothetical protein
MSITIYTTGKISIDGNDTGLGVTQRESGTVVFIRETMSTKYREIQMPSLRYSLAHDAPASGNPGRAQFEVDIRAAIHAES